nr:tetratricopeptide repeat protein [Planctomycetota bacterium]
AGGASDEAGLDGSRAGTRDFTVPITLRDLKARGELEGERAAQTIQALAVLYAAMGRTQELDELIDMALKAGVDPDRILDAILQLPNGERAKALGQLLERHPRVAFDAAHVAAIFADDGEPDRALEVVKRALPEEDGFRRRLTHMLLRLDPARGPAFLFRLPASESWSGRDLRYLRGYLIEQDRESELTQFLLRRLDDAPDDDAALRALGGLDRAAALSRARYRTEANPGDDGAWWRLGRLLEAEGDASAAFDAFAEAAKRNPGSTAFEALVATDAARAIRLIDALTADSADDELIGAAANAYLAAGQAERAAAIYRRALANDPGDDEWLEGLIETDPEGAVALLRGRIDAGVDSKDDEVIGRYAAALQGSGDAAAAYEQYERAFQRDPYDGDWQRGLAESDPSRAVALLAEHTRAHPDDASGLGAYGLALARAGRRGEAEEQLERAIATGDAEEWFAELHRVNPTKAIRALERRARRSRNDDLWGALGEAYVKAGNTAKARDAFSRALRIYPSSDRWADALRALR